MIENKQPEEIWPEFNSIPGRPELGGAPNVDGNPHRWEIDWLCRIARLVQAKTAFEFGTFNGATALHLAHVVERVLTLDLPAGSATRWPLSEFDQRWVGAAKIALPENVEQLWGDSGTFDFSPYQRQMDLVFVMGASTTEYSRHNLAAALELASPTGIVVWHTHLLDTPQLAEMADEYALTQLNAAGAAEPSRLVLVKASKRKPRRKESDPSAAPSTTPRAGLRTRDGEE